ncbi:MAG: hypothetical protein WC932_06130 [archaeon]|jgi:hypothetical protein
MQDQRSLVFSFPLASCVGVDGALAAAAFFRGMERLVEKKLAKFKDGIWVGAVPRADLLKNEMAQMPPSRLDKGMEELRAAGILAKLKGGDGAGSRTWAWSPLALFLAEAIPNVFKDCLKDAPDGCPFEMKYIDRGELSRRLDKGYLPPGPLSSEVFCGIKPAVFSSEVTGEKVLDVLSALNHLSSLGMPYSRVEEDRPCSPFLPELQLAHSEPFGETAWFDDLLDLATQFCVDGMAVPGGQAQVDPAPQAAAPAQDAPKDAAEALREAARNDFVAYCNYMKLPALKNKDVAEWKNPDFVALLYCLAAKDRKEEGGFSFPSYPGDPARMKPILEKYGHQRLYATIMYLGNFRSGIADANPSVGAAGFDLSISTLATDWKFNAIEAYGKARASLKAAPAAAQPAPREEPPVVQAQDALSDTSPAVEEPRTAAVQKPPDATPAPPMGKINFAALREKYGAKPGSASRRD